MSRVIHLRDTRSYGVCGHRATDPAWELTRDWAVVNCLACLKVKQDSPFSQVKAAHGQGTTQVMVPQERDPDEQGA